MQKNSQGQCQNNKDFLSACEWITGNLGAAHNVYRENDVVPFRVGLTDLTGGGAYEFYMMLQFKADDSGDHTHGYDFAATYNSTIVNANPCNDYGTALNTICEGGAGGHIKADMGSPVTGAMESTPSNLDAIAGAGTTTIQQAAVAAFEARGGTRNIIGYGVQSVQLVADRVEVSGPDIQIVYRVQFVMKPAETRAFILFGGHLARGIPSEWGVDGGAGSFQGSSLEIRTSGESGGANTFPITIAAVEIPGEVKGTFYEDVNGNGTFDSGTDSPLSGRAVHFYGTATLKDNSTIPIHFDGTTGSNGRFSFLTPQGNYKTCGAAVTGLWVQTESRAPVAYSCTNAEHTGSGANGYNDAGTAEPLTYGVARLAVLTRNFGYYQYHDGGTISGKTVSGQHWSDLNNDGIKDLLPTPGEPGLAGWTVSLTGTTGLGGSVSTTTTTDSNGNYGFSTLAPGAYTICMDEAQQSGWTRTYPVAATVACAGSQAGFDITVTSNSTVSNKDFGSHTAPGVAQACSPGYWKTHTNRWLGYTTGQLVSSVFTFTGDNKVNALKTSTLAQALAFTGGSGTDGAAKNLLRLASAALLDYSHSGITYSVTGIADKAAFIAAVNDALTQGSYNAAQYRDRMSALQSTLSASIIAGLCPLDGTRATTAP